MPTSPSPGEENLSAPDPSHSVRRPDSQPGARLTLMQHIVRIPAKYEAHVRAAINDALRDIDEGLVPPFMVDEHRKGESVITITESVASRHPTQENAA